MTSKHIWDRKGYIIGTSRKEILLKYIKSRTTKNYRLEVVDNGNFTSYYLFEEEELK